MQKALNTIRKSLLVVFTLLIATFGNAQSNGFEVITSLENLNEIYQNLEKYYGDDLKSRNM